MIHAAGDIQDRARPGGHLINAASIRSNQWLFPDVCIWIPRRLDVVKSQHPF
jgi:hypothetical protein